MSDRNRNKNQNKELPSLNNSQGDPQGETSEDRHEPLREGEPEENPTPEDPRETARNMLRQGIPEEEIATKTGLTTAVIYGLKGALRSSGELVPEGEAEETPSYLPPEIQYIQDAKAFIQSRLSEIYGIGASDKVVMRALNDDVSAMRDPNLLHAFIKSLAIKANDQQLGIFLIRPLFNQYPMLPNMVDMVTRGQNAPNTQPMYLGGSTGWSGRPDYTYRFNTGFGTGYGQEYGFPSVPVHQGYPPGYFSPSYNMPPKPPGKVHKVVYDGQEIETDADGYRAWQKFIQEEKDREEEKEQRKEKHELEMTELKKRIEDSGKDEKTIPVDIDGQKIDVPMSMAPLYLGLKENPKMEELRTKLEEAKEARNRESLERLEKKIEDQPSFMDQLNYYNSVAPQLGFHTGAKSTLDLVDSAREDFNVVAQKILSKMPGGNQDFIPQVNRTPQERDEKARQILEGLDKTEGLLAAEDELMKAASKVT